MCLCVCSLSGFYNCFSFLPNAVSVHTWIHNQPICSCLSSRKSSSFIISYAIGSSLYITLQTAWFHMSELKTMSNQIQNIGFCFFKSGLFWCCLLYFSILCDISCSVYLKMVFVYFYASYSRWNVIIIIILKAQNWSLIDFF